MHLMNTVRGFPGRLIQTTSQAELFRALFITLREGWPDRLFVHIESVTDEPLLAEAVIADDDDDWWKTDDAATIIAILMDELHDQAPEGHFFGPLDNDPTDYGYWPVPPEFADEPNPRWRGIPRNPDYVPPTGKKEPQA